MITSMKLLVLFAISTAHAAPGCANRMDTACAGWSTGMLSLDICFACVERHLAALNRGHDGCLGLADARDHCNIGYHPGDGCQEALTKFCPAWKTEGTAKCEACAKQNQQQLDKEGCDAKKIKKKCSSPPGPGPSPVPPSPGPKPLPDFPKAPPAPRLTPKSGAPQPHIIMFVVDDEGWANVGYKNNATGNVHTPNQNTLVQTGVILDRHYIFRWCAPTRSALMTGRLPYHVREKVDHVSRGMTMLPRKLQQVGYATHQIGKWHLGSQLDWMVPAGRGFNTSLGYLAGAEDHWTQRQDRSKVFGCTGVDLYETAAPAYGKNQSSWGDNGTSYGSYIYDAEFKRIISAHEKSQPIFVYYAIQVMHAPQEVPDSFYNLYPQPEFFHDYAIQNGMAAIGDQVLGNMTATLKAAGMWENTLVIHTTDNGGPAGEASSGHSGNNWPLRGGKTNSFDGGIRGAAFLAGGFLPTTLHGTTLTGLMHGCDWYATVAGLAGVPAADPNPYDASIPPIDSLDMWPFITGAVSKSPRTEIVFSSESDSGGMITEELSLKSDGTTTRKLWKLLTGVSSYGFWQGPRYPNATTDHSTEKEVDCGGGCLFEVEGDPSEYVNLANTKKAKLTELQKLWNTRIATAWPTSNDTNNWNVGTDPTACTKYTESHHGFIGPYLST